MSEMPLVYISKARGSERYDVYSSTNGFQAWNVVQGVLTLDAAAQIALLVARHMAKAMLADIQAKLDNPAGTRRFADDTPWDEIPLATQGAIISGWERDKREIINRLPTSYEEILVRD